MGQEVDESASRKAHHVGSRQSVQQLFGFAIEERNLGISTRSFVIDLAFFDFVNEVRWEALSLFGTVSSVEMFRCEFLCDTDVPAEPGPKICQSSSLVDGRRWRHLAPTPSHLRLAVPVVSGLLLDEHRRCYHLQGMRGQKARRTCWRSTIAGVRRGATGIPPPMTSTRGLGLIVTEIAMLSLRKRGIMGTDARWETSTLLPVVHSSLLVSHLSSRGQKHRNAIHPTPPRQSSATRVA